jgi:DMSO/TMAO reductase YedYZ molybdopterin-dependent catalytic subunit
LGTIEINRRQLLRMGGTAALSVAAPALAAAESEPRRRVRFPEKADLILLTDRPPQLETPLHYFRQDLTPNEAYFVRWHMAAVPTRVDLASFRLIVDGAVETPLSLSVADLRRDFEQVSFIALNQCSGNSRSFFTPRVAGSQWKHGAMGNARWTGIRLRDLLARAGLKGDVTDIAISGLDGSPMPGLPKMRKALSVDHANDGDILIAYLMNGTALPMLNGFPLRLVVPGWYATYWIKALHHVEARTTPLHNVWMDTAYRVPDNATANESEDALAKTTVPINRFSIHSIFVRPEPGETLPLGRPYQLEGLAMDSGHGITAVEVSMDGGRTWLPAVLDPDLGRFSWRRWRLAWTPGASGPYRLKVRATNKAGEEQLTAQWNHGGYARRVIEETSGMVTG